MKKLLFVVLATIFSTTMFAQAGKRKLPPVKTPFLPISQLNMSLNEGKKINGGAGNIDITMPMVAAIKTYAKEEGTNA